MHSSNTRPSRTVRRLASALLAATVAIGAGALGVSAAAVLQDNRGSGPSADGSARAGKVFELSGDLNAPLVLGATGQPVDLAVTNPNRQTLYVSEIRVVVAGVSTSDCSSDEFGIQQSTATISVPPRSTVRLTGDQRPRVSWANDPSANQDACVGVGLSFSYTGKGALR